MITNSFGSQEDSADLKVRSAPEITQMLDDVEAKEGETGVAFTVKANAYPEPKITWYTRLLIYLIAVTLFIRIYLLFLGSLTKWPSQKSAKNLAM